MCPQMLRYRSPLLVAVVFGMSCLGAAATYALMSVPTSGWRLGDPPAPATTADAREVMVRIGLRSEAIAASGLTGADAVAMLAAVRQSLSGRVAELALADDDLRKALGARDKHERVLRAGGSDASTVAMQAASAAVLDATSRRDMILGVAWVAATTGLSEEAYSRLLVSVQNRGRHADAQYLVVQRTDLQWTLLREALTATRAKVPVGPSDEAAAYLASANAEPAVVAAKAALDAGLADVRAALTQ